MSTIMDRETGELVFQSMQHEEGRTKVGQAAGNFIRTRMRETSVMDQIITPQPVGQHEMVPGVNLASPVVLPGRTQIDGDDTITIIRSVEKEGTAMLLDFRADPKAAYINGDRYAIPFGLVSTLLYEKRAEELLANNYDILGIIAKTAFLETHTERDKKWLAYCDLAVAASNNIITAPGPIQRSVFRAITHPGLRHQIPPKTVLMSQTAFTDLGLWDHSDLGPEVANVTAHGYKATRVGDLTFICSIKSPLFDTFENGVLKSTKIYCFPPQHYLGHSLYHGDFQVWNAWTANLWQYRGWQLFGCGIGNINGITRLDLTYPDAA